MLIALKSSSNFFALKLAASSHFDGVVSCNRLKGVSVSGTPPPSLVPALCNISGRVGKQRYMFTSRSTSYRQTVTDLGFAFMTGVARKVWGVQFLHNVALSIKDEKKILKYQQVQVMNVVICIYCKLWVDQSAVLIVRSNFQHV